MKGLYFIVIIFLMVLSYSANAQEGVAEAIMKKEKAVFNPPSDQLPKSTVEHAINPATLNEIIRILEGKGYKVVKNWFEDKDKKLDDWCYIDKCCTDVISVEKDGQAYAVIIFNDNGKVLLRYCDYKSKTTRM